MKNRMVAFLCLFAAAAFSIAGCGKNAEASPDAGSTAEPDSLRTETEIGSSSTHWQWKESASKG